MAGLAHLVPGFYSTLLSTQRAPQSRIRAYQHGLLEKLVRHARAHVPFYRDTGRLAPLFGAGDRFDMGGWPDVPVLTRAEAFDHHEALVAGSVPAEMLPLHDDNTSGSTGLPLPFKRCELAQVVSAALIARLIGWHRALPVTRFAVLRPTGGGGGAPLLPDGFAAGAPVVVSTDGDVETQIEGLVAAEPSLVLGRANVLLAIAEAMGRRRLSGIRLVIQTGELLRPEARSAISRAFGAPVADVYSTSELGPVALEDGAGGLALAEENVFVDWPDIPDPGRPAPLVVTPFYAYGTPLIRYAPGDHVRFAAGSAADTPALRRIAGVVGRERSLFRRADGSRFSPELSGWRIAEIVRVRRWRLTQTSLAGAVFEVMLDEPADAARLSALKGLVEAAVPPLAVEVRPVEDLADDRAGGKAFEAYRCMV